MPTDPVHLPPPSGTAAPVDETAQQEAALVRALLHRVQSSGDKAHLQERCEVALQLILNREEDRSLRDELTADISLMLTALPEDVTDGPGREALAKVIDASLGVLKVAEQHRLASLPASPPPVSEVKAPSVADSAAGYERKATAQEHHAASSAHVHLHATHAHFHPPAKQSAGSLLGMLGMLLVIVAIGVAIALRDREQSVRPLVAQMEGATHGSIPATNIFGGSLRVAVQGGRTVVTVEGIPPGECVSSGWDLVRKGLLTVNGVTPPRVSAARLNDLCHEEDAATMVWSPKEK